MSDMIKQLVLDESPLENLDTAEVYVQRSIVHTYEANANACRTFEKILDGTAVRAFDAENYDGCMYIFDGDNLPSNWLEKARVNSIEYSTLPRIAVASDLSEYNLKMPNLVNADVDIYAVLYAFCKEKGLELKNAVVQNYVSLFKIANTYGVRGYGYKTYCEIFFDLAGAAMPGVQSFYKVAPCFNINDAMLALNRFEHSNIRKLESAPRFDRIMLSSNAAFELLFMLQFFLNSNMLKMGASYFGDKIDMLMGEQIASPLLNITENSPHNLTVGGIVDTEGTLRKPMKIIKNGCLVGILSGFSADSDISTGSAYRADYSVVPQTMATSVYVDAGQTISADIIKSADCIAVAESFQGLMESIDSMTLDFTAIIDMQIYRNGKNLGLHSKKIHTNILKVLNSICDISADCEYAGEGTFFLPSIVCDFTKM